MDQLNDFADDRLLSGCIFCGGIAETRDHVPSKAFLERPYPENLPVVGACRECNDSFSKDEQYLACLVESAIAGSTDPKSIRRESVARTLERSPALRARIQEAWSESEGRTKFSVESDRVVKIMLKLARGHAVFELSKSCAYDPTGFWCGPLETLSADERDLFEAVHFQQNFGEVGSRGMQRMIVAEVTATPVQGGDVISSGLIVNDWLDVQEENYRYQAIHDQSQVVIRIVIAEYLGCEVVWADSEQPDCRIG